MSSEHSHYSSPRDYGEEFHSCDESGSVPLFYLELADSGQLGRLITKLKPCMDTLSSFRVLQGITTTYTTLVAAALPTPQ